MARILVIDDDPLVRFALRQVLGRATGAGLAHAIVEADGAESGIAAARDGAFDLALVDMIMPERSGLDALPALRELQPGIRLIAISGGARSDNGSMLAAAARLGVTGVLRKPFTARELRGVVDQVLGGGGMPPEDVEG
jgi:DNA-binding NarL/FixJ family response regulator